MIYTKIPLYSDISYTFNMNLEGGSKTFTFYINQRANSLHMDIQENGAYLEKGFRIVPGLLKVNGIAGTLVLFPTNTNTVFKDVLAQDIYSKYKLFYYPV